MKLESKLDFYDKTLFLPFQFFLLTQTLRIRLFLSTNPTPKDLFLFM